MIKTAYFYNVNAQIVFKNSALIVLGVHDFEIQSRLLLTTSRYPKTPNASEKGHAWRRELKYTPQNTEIVS